MRSLRLPVVLSLAIALVLLVSPAALACDTSTWITSDPGTGKPGDVVTVRGGGFKEGSVLIRWDASDGAVVGEAPVAGDGSISIQVTVPDAQQGMHKFVAEHSAGSHEVAHADSWSYFEIPGEAAGEPGEGEKPVSQAPEQEQHEAVKADAPESAPAAVLEPASALQAQTTTSVPAVAVAEPQAARSGATKVGKNAVPAPAKLPMAAGGDGIVDLPAVEAAEPAEIPAASQEGLSLGERVALAAAFAAIALWLIVRRVWQPRRDADVVAIGVQEHGREDKAA